MKNIFLSAKPISSELIKGDLLLRHLWKETPNECKSLWQYDETIVIDGVLQYTTLNSSFRDWYKAFVPQNVYITSEEEIKNDDYGIYIYENSAYKINLGINGSIKNAYKKIVLTDDPLLIKDGVQAIPNEFLKWFVKNPSCEFVDVNKEEFYSKKEFMKGEQAITYNYKIMIPESKSKLTSKKYLDKMKTDGLSELGKYLLHESKDQTIEELFESFMQANHCSAIITPALVLGAMKSAVLWQKSKEQSENKTSSNSSLKKLNDAEWQKQNDKNCENELSFIHDSLRNRKYDNGFKHGYFLGSLGKDCLYIKEEVLKSFDYLGFKQITTEELNSLPYQPFITDEDRNIWIIDKETWVEQFKKK